MRMQHFVAATAAAAYLLATLLLLLAAQDSDAARFRWSSSSSRKQRRRSAVNAMGFCPKSCQCNGRRINCSHKYLTAVPNEVPVGVRRLNLQSNQISTIRRQDFRNLKRLRILQLHKNRIEVIEPGAFNGMLKLKRLRLDSNRLRHIPNGVFGPLPHLVRLDISYNKLEFIGRSTLPLAPQLKNLQLDHNKIKCVTELALKRFKNLDFLSLNSNNISTLPIATFSLMPNLRTLRLAKNNLICDCRLQWLSTWLRQNPQLGLQTKCHLPRQLSGERVAELATDDFQCSADHDQLYPPQCGLAEQPTCPKGCSCQDNIVRCSGIGFTEVPSNIPVTVQELHLDNNSISRLPAHVFKNLTQLSRLMLNRNRITQIELGAFNSLDNLYSLILSQNQIRELPRGLFDNLRQLQLLLLDNNEITCVPSDIVAKTKNIVILSLHKNRIKSIASGTFKSLKSVMQVSISGNPFICDCNLRWLNDFSKLLNNSLVRVESICAEPKRMKGESIGKVSSDRFECVDIREGINTRNAGRCDLFTECPKKCHCKGESVDCSSADFTELPSQLPVHTKHLNMAKNKLKSVSSNSILTKLPNLESIDLSNNEIELIEPGSFKANSKLTTLLLASNWLRDLDRRMLIGLGQLTTLQVSTNRISCLNNDTFDYTTKITMLSLSQNEIRCIMEGTFAPLRQLKSLHIDLNPLNCNCHMKWLPQYTVQHYSKMLNALPRCQSPVLLAGTLAVSLKSDYFVCKQNNKLTCGGVQPCCSRDAVSCDRRFSCPPGCDCDGTTVRCIDKRLTDIPDDLPTDTTQLFLSRNQLKDFNISRLNRLKNLKFLDLTHNKLRGLTAKMFANLTNLTTLSLGHNDMQCIDSGAFAGLKYLNALQLHNNKLSSLPFAIFDDVPSLMQLTLHNNPIHCDCNAKWLNDYLRRNHFDLGMTICASPPALTLRSVYHTDAAEFLCTSSVSNNTKCDICHSNPCQNGGKCTAISFDKFSCKCTGHFIGSRCEQPIDACFDKPCRNNATCIPTEFGRYRCQCQSGFAGAYCEQNINDCADNECRNGAVCVDGIGNYSCKCSVGFGGRFCNEKINYCDEFNPCENAATCRKDSRTGYRCICRRGWEGNNCHININDCQSANICLNGGACIDGIGNFTCVCRPGYSGSLCQTVQMPGLIMDASHLVNTGVCTHHECLNGGRCQSDGNEYRCRCVTGYEGKKCERLTQVGFHSDSYATIQTNALWPQANITFTLATRQSLGMVIYAGDDSVYLIVSIYSGYIRLTYSLGQLPAAKAYSNDLINDGQFHTIQININRQYVEFIVDKTARNISATLPGVDNGDDVALLGPISVGAMPKKRYLAVGSNIDIRETFSFGGCIKQMQINTIPVNFKQNRAQNKELIDGCPTFHKPENQCLSKLQCRNRGKCIPRPDLIDGFVCQCKHRYTGKRCEEKACKRTASREFYTDASTGCRSIRTVKMRRCEGTCPHRGGMCCQPKMFKRRRMQLRCPGGRTFYKIVHMVKRCRCKPCGAHNRMQQQQQN